MLARLRAGQREGRRRCQAHDVAELRVRNPAAYLHFILHVQHMKSSKTGSFGGPIPKNSLPGFLLPADTRHVLHTHTHRHKRLTAFFPGQPG